MSTRNRKKIYNKRPNSFGYILQLLRYASTATFFREVFYLFAYYVINHVKGISKANIGKGSRLWPTVLLRNAERIYIGDNTTINHNNILWAGRQSAVIRIGNNVMTGPNVQMIAYNHYYENEQPLREYFTEQDIIIEDNVWLGANVIVLAGAKVGRGVVVGAGAIVIGDLPPHTVCVGVPAKAIKTLQ